MKVRIAANDLKDLDIIIGNLKRLILLIEQVIIETLREIIEYKFYCKLLHPTVSIILSCTFR